MATGLSVNRLIRTSVNLSPVAAARRGFGTLLVCGDSDVIDVVERIRSYTTLETVATDFGTSAPEYKAAVLYFSQSPRPTTLMIGRWARNATPAILRGGALNSVEQNIATWNAITNGGFNITIGGVAKNVTALDFSGAATLTAVAALIQAGISG